MNLRVRRLSTVALGLCLFVGTIVFFVAIVALGGQEYTRVAFSKTYYFLVKSCSETSLPVVSQDIYSAGGAGYYLEGDDAVAIACYFKETSAQSVQRNLQSEGTETELLKRESGELILRGKKSGFKPLVESNLETVDQLAHILYDTANGLERSEISQREAKAAVEGVASSLKGLREGNRDEFFTAWNMGIREAERRSAELTQGLLFAKDLRYVQTMLCDKTVNLTNYFA